MDFSFIKKKSTTLKNQDFINYLEKIVELLIKIDQILCGCKIASLSSLI